jgi:hypothetical protein
MGEYVGLDASMEDTSVCVMDAAGEIIREGKAATEPGELARTLHLRAPAAVKVGLETGPLSTWLWHTLREAQVPVVCLDARHAQAALSMRINKTDKNDAVGLAQLVWPILCASGAWNAAPPTRTFSARPRRQAQRSSRPSQDSRSGSSLSRRGYGGATAPWR